MLRAVERRSSRSVGRDQVDLDLLQFQTAMSGHAFDTLPLDRQVGLGEVDQDRSGPRDRVPAKAGGAAGHAQGYVQSRMSSNTWGSRRTG